MTPSRSGKNPKRPDRPTREKSPKARPEPAEAFDELEPIEDEEQLDTLEAIEDDDLESLEPWEGASETDVRVAHQGAAGGGVHLRVEVSTELAKQEIGDALRRALRASAAEFAAAARWQVLLVEFTGEALIPSAAKQIVADFAAQLRARSATVQRGFGDEVVHEAAPPRLSVAIEATGDLTQVRVGAEAGVEPSDVAALFAGEIPAIRERVAGRKVDVHFDVASPDDATLAQLRESLVAGGATRVAVHAGSGDAASRGPLVLFDAELSSRVVVRDSSRRGWDTEVEFAPSADDAVSSASLDLVLPGVARQLADRDVLVKLPSGAPSSASRLVRDRLVAAGVGKVGLAVGDGSVDIVHPPLLAVGSDRQGTRIEVQPHGRDAAAQVRAFERELAVLHEQVRGQDVVIDLPRDFVVDAEFERRCVHEGVGRLAPKSIVYTFQGEDREPVVPPALRIDDDRSGAIVCDVDLDVAKPADVARAVDRRLGSIEFGDRDVVVRLRGEGAVPRRLRQAIVDRLEAGRARRAEIDDHGSVELVLPRLFALSAGKSGSAQEIRVGVNLADRSAAQIAIDAARELAEASLPSGAVVHLSPSPAEAALVAALVTAGAERVLVDGVLVHPPLFAVETHAAGLVVLRARPLAGSEEAELLRQVERELPGALDAMGDSLPDTSITLSWPGASRPFDAPLALTIEQTIVRDPKSLHLDPGDGKPARQLHPIVTREFVRVLGRKEDSAVPITLLGVDASEGADDAAAIVAGLRALDPTALDGRRVLVIVFANGRPQVVAASDPVWRAVQDVLQPQVAALLAYAGEDPVSHFVVRHSQLAEMAIGDKMRDPRSGRG